MCVPAWLSMYVCMCVRALVCVCACMYVNVCVSVCVCVCVCECVCVSGPSCIRREIVGVGLLTFSAQLAASEDSV